MLDSLLEVSDIFKGAGVALPIYAPYHAPELFRQIDTRKLALGRRLESLDTMNQHLPCFSLLSTSTGTHYEASTTLDLFELVIYDILVQTLRWDRALDACVSEIAASNSSATKVFAFGPTKAASSLASALQANNDRKVSVEDSSSWLSNSRQASLGSSGSCKNSKLAIVGLAGRFPDGADIEGFWDTLEKGLDVHKEVPFY